MKAQCVWLAVILCLMPACATYKLLLLDKSDIEKSLTPPDMELVRIKAKELHYSS